MKWIVVLILLGAPTALWAEGGSWTGFFGGGLSVPTGQTADFTHSTGAFEGGLGYRFTERQSILADYFSAPLPLNSMPFERLKPLDPDSNLYAVTANYRYVTRKSGLLRPYFVAGGGWYRRVITVSKVSAGTLIACSSAVLWFHYACTTGFVPLETVVAGSKSDVLGYNAGGGVIIAPKRWGPHIFVEVRYHTASHPGVPTHLVPLIVGGTW